MCAYGMCAYGGSPRAPTRGAPGSCKSDPGPANLQSKKDLRGLIYSGFGKTNYIVINGRFNAVGSGQ